MLSTSRQFPAFDVTTSFDPDQQTRFFADLGDVRVHRNHVEHIQQAHAIHAKTLKAAQAMLDALAAPAREVRQVIDFAGEQTPRSLEQINAQKERAAHAIIEARAEMVAARREMQSLVERCTVSHWLTETVLAQGPKVTEARGVVDLLPANMLPSVLRDAIDAGDTARTAAVLHRLQHDATLSEAVREEGLTAFAKLLQPVREALRRIDHAANTVVSFAEHQADTLASYPGRVDPMRMLQRANQQSVFPALHDGITLDSGPSLLASANNAVPRPRTTKPQLTTFAAAVESTEDGEDDDLPPAA